MGTAIANWLLKWQADRRSRMGVGGTVFTGIDKKGQAVALKVVQYTDVASYEGDFNQEVASLELLRHNPHRNIIRLLDSVLDTSAMSSGIAMELANMDLCKLLKTHSHRLDPDMAHDFICQLVAGVDHLHKHDIVHRDIKPTNLLVCFTVQATTLKIGDINSSKMASKVGRGGSIVTSWYRAPEVFHWTQKALSKFSKAADVWSMGCVLWELCIGCIAFPGDTDHMVGAMIEHRLGPPLNYPIGFPKNEQLHCMPPGFCTLAEAEADTGREELNRDVQLIRFCLRWRACRRLSAEQCRKHCCGAGGCDPVGLVPAQPETARSSECSSACSSSCGPSQAKQPSPLQAAITGSCPSDPALRRRQRGRTLPCQCVGNCQTGHRAGTPCPRMMVSTLPRSSGQPALCDLCLCSSPDCTSAKFRSPFCYKHAYLGLSQGFTVIRTLSDERVLQRMAPQELTAFSKAKDKRGHDIAFELLAAWINDPTAIKHLLTEWPTMECYTGKQLLFGLQQAHSP